MARRVRGFESAQGEIKNLSGEDQNPLKGGLKTSQGRIGILP
jgi:hypothetical protein